MGYRTYLGSMSKERYNKTKELSRSEIQKYLGIEQDDYMSGYDILEKQSLFEFGKYEDFGPDSYIYEQLELEGDFQIVNKENLIKILDGIREKVSKYYKELLYAQTCNLTRKKLRKIHDREMDKKFENINFGLVQRCDRLKNITPKGYVIHEIKGKIRAWKDLDHINGSWLWEYEFFKLREIVNTFDFENNILVYYGY